MKELDLNNEMEEVKNSVYEKNACSCCISFLFFFKLQNLMEE